MLDEQGNEVLPKFSVAEIARWRTKLTQAIMVFDGVVVQGQQLVNLSHILTDVVSGKTAVDKCDLRLPGTAEHLYGAVYETVLAHIGSQPVNRTTAKHLADIVAGNVHLIRAGQDIPVWRYQPEAEWALAKTIDVYPTITPQRQIHGHNLVLEVLTGRAAGRTIHQFSTEGMIGRMARKLGLRNLKNRKPVHARELVMTYMYIKLKPGEKLEIAEYRERSGLNTRNRSRAVQRAAYRQLCPIDSKWPCTFCRIGVDECPLATHPTAYVRGTCRKGHSGWVRDGAYEPVCMACQQRSWTSKYGGSYVREEESSSVCPTDQVDPGYAATVSRGSAGRPEDAQIA